MDLLTPRETAADTRLSERTLERHRLTGTGPKFVRLGSRVLYRRQNLEEWVANCTVTSTAEAYAGKPGSTNGVKDRKRSHQDAPATGPDDQIDDHPHPPLGRQGAPLEG